MVVDVGDPGRIVEIGVEELQMLAQAVPRGHAPTQTVVTVLDGPASRLTVDPEQETWITQRKKDLIDEATWGDSPDIVVPEFVGIVKRLIANTTISHQENVIFV